MTSRRTASSPPTEPLRNFEHNLARIKQLMAIHATLAPAPGKPPQWRSDIAAAAIVMMLAAVDTYFDDRLRAEFETRFDLLEPKLLASIISRMLVAADGSALNAGSSEMLARALQSGQPKSVVIQHFASLVEATTYQEPHVIARDIALFGVSNIWGRVSHCWEQKFGEKKAVEPMFREWASRRHGIAHRSGRSRSIPGVPLTTARPGQNATRDEAKACIDLFARVIALVDYQLNQSLYGRQPRTRKSEIAVFDLQPLARGRRRSLVSGKKPGGSANRPSTTKKRS